MPDNALLQGGAVIVGIVIILDRVFNFVRTTKASRNGSLKDGGTDEKLRTEIWRQGRVGDTLFDVHLGPRALDKNGEPKWYIASEIQTERHNEIVLNLKKLVSVNNEIRDRLDSR